MSKRAPVSFGLVCATARYYWSHRRYIAGLRALALTILWRHGSELCQECGRRYSKTLWHAPTPLYVKLNGSAGGLLCPACFGRRAEVAGLGRVVWVPTLGTEAWDIHDPVRA